MLHTNAFNEITAFFFQKYLFLLKIFCNVYCIQDIQDLPFWSCLIRFLSARDSANFKKISSVEGVWPEGSDGTDINALVRSRNRKVIAVADDFCKVHLFQYPCSKPKVCLDFVVLSGWGRSCISMCRNTLCLICADACMTWSRNIVLESWIKATTTQKHPFKLTNLYGLNIWSQPRKCFASLASSDSLPNWIILLSY